MFCLGRPSLQSNLNLDDKKFLWNPCLKMLVSVIEGNLKVRNYLQGKVLREKKGKVITFNSWKLNIFSWYFFFSNDKQPRLHFKKNTFPVFKHMSPIDFYWAGSGNELTILSPYKKIGKQSFLLFFFVINFVWRSTLGEKK